MYNSNDGYTPNIPEDEERNEFNKEDYYMPDLNRQDYEEGSEPSSNESIPVDTTYHFSGQDDNLPFGSYAEDSRKQEAADEPQFVVQESKPEEKLIRPNYQYSESNQSHSGGGGEGGGKSGKGLFAKVAAVAVVCSLVFGTAGGYLGSMLNRSFSDNQAAATVLAAGNTDVNTVKDESADNSPNITTTSAVTGGVMTATEIYELATKQVVSVTATGVSNYYGQEAASEAMGTGFVISEDGYIITNYHVISNAVSGGSVSVSFKNGESYEAEIIGGYEAGDVALLKIEAAGLPAASLGDSNNITVGENIYVVGNALGEYDYSFTGGLVSGLDRLMTFSSDSGASETINMFQIDAAVNSGNSGGPVYNSRGEVIGIVTSKISSSYSFNSASVEGLGFAIPINDALSIVNDIQTKGYVEGNVLLNVNVRTVDSSVVESYGIPSGVYVDSLAEGGAAQVAGVQAKDIITKIDDKEVTSVSDLKEALKNYSVGDTAKLTVYRTGEYKELTVSFTETETTETTVSAPPEDAQNSQGYPDGYSGGSDQYGGAEGSDPFGGSGGSDPFGGMFG